MAVTAESGSKRASLPRKSRKTSSGLKTKRRRSQAGTHGSRTNLKKFRLNNGVYGILNATDLQMIRIKCPARRVDGEPTGRGGRHDRTIHPHQNSPM